MKTLFTLKPHSFVDVITNSSSELFVGNLPKRELQRLLAEAYPGYLSEYEGLKSIEELSNDELETYISYHYDGWSNSRQQTKQKLVPGFTSEEMYGPVGYRGCWNFVQDHNRVKIMNGIDPYRKMFFLFSLEQNPDWEMQERLMNFMKRYHLG